MYVHSVISYEKREIWHLGELSTNLNSAWHLENIQTMIFQPTRILLLNIIILLRKREIGREISMVLVFTEHEVWRKR